MALREILTFPDPRLAEKSLPVVAVDDGIRLLVDDMFETMYKNEGVGLAAPQVGALVRVLVIDCGEREGHDPDAPLTPSEPIALINPEIVAREGTISWEEGCLSVPGYSDAIERSRQITVRFLNRDGEPQTLTATGLLSVCIQHEIDHLEGILFVDRLSRLKQQMVKKKLKKRAEEAYA